MERTETSILGTLNRAPAHIQALFTHNQKAFDEERRLMERWAGMGFVAVPGFNASLVSDAESEDEDLEEG